ncbi:hypothetical protein LCGC14_2276810, partial [marine sediment metagenome]
MIIGSIINQGTYSAKFQTNSGTIYQDVDSTNDYGGCEIVFTAYVRAGSASQNRLGINDGQSTTYGSYHTGGSSFEQLTVSKTLALDEDKIRLICDHSNTGTAGYFDGAMTCTVTALTIGVQTAHSEFNDNLYQSFGAVLAKLNSTTFDFVAVMPATITDMHVMNWSGTDYLYIGQGDSDDLIYMTTAELLTSSASNERAYFFTGSPTVLYGVKQAGGNKVRKATAVDTWADVTLVGNGYENHTDLLMAPDNNIIIGKENIPYYSDGTTDDQNPLMAHFKSLTSSTTCKNSLQAFGATYIQGGDQTLYEYQGTTGSAVATQTNISPANFMSGLSDFNGKIQAIAADDVYLYGVLGSVNLIPDPGFETGVTEWTAVGSGVTWAQSSEQAYSGTYSGKLTRNGTNCRAYYSLPNYADYAGRTVTFKMRVYATVASRARLNINDGVGGSFSSYHTGGSGWEQLTVTHTVNANPTALQLRGWIQDGDTSAYFDDAEFNAVEIMAGQYETVSGVTAWRWHGSLAEITLTGCEVAYVSNVTKKRLYICSTAAGEDMYYLPVTTKYGDITSDSDYTWQTGGYEVTPW